MRISVLAVTLASLVLMLAPRCALAQATLDRAETLLRNGSTEQARTTLEQWKKANKEGTSPSAARAAFLTGRLATRVADAEDSYLTVALNHPTSPYAAESLLRLGQGRLASGDAKQAVVYLQRLMADYPRSEQRALGAVWLARAHAAAGRAQGGCAEIDDALKTAQPDSETAALLRAEQTNTCQAERVAETPPRTAPVQKPPTATPTTQKPATSTPAAGRFTIQVAAFRERNGARATARELERAGFSGARLVTVPDNTLIRVRLGQFENAAAAAAQVSKLKAAGFSAVVVADAQREKLIRE